MSSLPPGPLCCLYAGNHFGGCPNRTQQFTEFSTEQTGSHSLKQQADNIRLLFKIKHSMLTPAHKHSGTLRVVVFTNTYCDIAKLDRSSSALDTNLVASLGYFLPDKPRSVPESNPNSEDESKSEDRRVAKTGRK